MEAQGQPIAASQDEEPAEEYAIVEIFGHRHHAGRIMEVDRFGSKMLRIDVPKDGDFGKGFTTHFYGGASIFSMTPCDLGTVQRANRPYQPASLLTHTPDEFEEAETDELEEEIEQ